MPIFINNQYLNANDVNSLVEGLKGNGVINGLSVSANSPVAMNVIIAAGTALVNATYVTINQTTVSISATNGTYPRKDIISLNSSGTLTATAGTADQAIPSANVGIYTNNPIAPVIPTNEIILAEIWVAANVTTITSAVIYDKRVIIPTQNYGGTTVATHTITVTHGTAEQTVAEITPIRNGRIAVSFDLATLVTAGEGGTIIVRLKNKVDGTNLTELDRADFIIGSDGTHPSVSCFSQTGTDICRVTIQVNSVVSQNRIVDYRVVEG